MRAAAAKERISCLMMPRSRSLRQLMCTSATAALRLGSEEGSGSELVVAGEEKASASMKIKRMEVSVVYKSGEEASLCEESVDGEESTNAWSTAEEEKVDKDESEHVK